MYILGINGGFRAGYQDVSACIVKDGEVIAAVEEERLTKIKFSAGKLPYYSIIEVLSLANISFDEVEEIAFHGESWDDEIQPRLEDYFNYHFGVNLPIVRYHHHDCHAASTFYASGFEQAIIITIDNSGDGVSTQVMFGSEGQLQLIDRFERPNSFGLFYQIITQVCGFQKDNEEYKLMGLSSYGDRKKHDFSWLFDFKDGELNLNQKYIQKLAPGASSLHKDEMVFDDVLLERLAIQPRKLEEPFSEAYKDLAASAQQHIEDVMLKMIEYYSEKLKCNHFCFAGGVALNCVMNKSIMNHSKVHSIFIQPASTDAGISLGAAWLATVKRNIQPIPQVHTYLGRSFSNNEIEHTLKNLKLKYEKIEEPEKIAAQLITADKIIGWFQGKMEFGPRGLGNRSILANPTAKGMNDKVNLAIKFRESFRPLCPSVLEEDFDLYFKGKKKVSPYMTITYDIIGNSVTDVIPAVIHVDNTARIQTVNEKVNPLYYRLLQNLKRLNGHGVVLNTSFNLANQPIVNTPQDAIATFYACGMDALIIGDYLIEK